MTLIRTFVIQHLFEWPPLDAARNLKFKKQHQTPYQTTATLRYN